MKMQMLRFSSSLLLYVGSLHTAHAEFSNLESNIQYAHALSSSEDKVLGYGADSDDLHTIRFQHESDYRLGSNFVLLDYLWSNQPLGGPVFGPDNPVAYQYGPGDSTYFGVAGTELHTSKLFGHAQGAGFVKDFGLSARVERGGYYEFRALEIGPQIHLNVPGFERFKLTAWRRWKSDVSGSAGEGGFDVGKQRSYRTHWLLGADWRASWQMFGQKWSSQLFVRYQVKDGGKAGARGTENINGIPARWWIEPDVFIYFNEHLGVGLRAYYLQQSDAIDNGYSSVGRNSHVVPQIVFKAAVF